MAKKKKRSVKAHDLHHQAIHDYIVKQVHAESNPNQQHVVPVRQPWHQPNPFCWCRPVCVHTHPVNGGTVWRHSNLVH